MGGHYRLCLEGRSPASAWLLSDPRGRRLREDVGDRAGDFGSPRGSPASHAPWPSAQEERF